jgi:sugar lactone lactonase YvrE
MSAPVSRSVLPAALTALLLAVAAPAVSAQSAVVSGQLDTVAGTLGAGHAEDVRLYVEAFAVGGGQLYLPDNGVVRQVDVASGSLSVLAGSGVLTPASRATSQEEIRTARAAAVHPAGGVVVVERDIPGRVVRILPDGTVSVLAGDDVARDTGDSDDWGDGGTATQVPMSYAEGVAVAADGTVYVSQPNYHRIRRIDPSGAVSTVAGTGSSGFTGDGGPATAAQLSWPRGLALDAQGRLYIADSANQRVRRVDTDGRIETVAGSGTDAATGLEPACPWTRQGLRGGFSGDGGRAREARLHCPAGVAVDPNGALLVTDTINNRVRRVDAGGTISTVAGNGAGGFGAEGAAATQTSLWIPTGIGVDGGAVYVTDGNRRVRRTGADGRIATVAGRIADHPARQDGRPATDVQLDSLGRTAVAPDGSVLLMQRYDVRRIESDGRLTTIAGREPHPNGWDAPPADGLHSTEAYLAAVDVDYDARGRLLLAMRDRVLVQDDAGVLRRVAGGGSADPADGVRAVDAALWPTALLSGPDGTLLVANERETVWQVDVDGLLRRYMGTPDAEPEQAEDGQPAREVALGTVVDLAAEADGSVLVTSYSLLWRVLPDGTVERVAGRTLPAFREDPSVVLDPDVAREARVTLRSAVGAPDGVVYVADGARLRRITPDGAIRTVAGVRLEGFAGDGGPARDGLLSAPAGLSLAPTGDLLFVDGPRVRTVRQVAGAAGERDPQDRPRLRVEVSPETVRTRSERIDPRDPAAPPAHPGVVKVTARASSAAGVREVRIEALTVFGSGSGVAAPRKAVELYVTSPGTHHLTVTATDARGVETAETVSFRVMDTAEALASACEGAPSAGYSDTAQAGVHAAAVDCLAWWGVTRGTGSGAYLPANGVTRAQLAGFLARVPQAAGVPLDAGSDHFTDDAGSVHERSINALASVGVIAGTGPGRYSPDLPVTRAQLATLLSRAYTRASGLALDTDVSYFLDDAFNSHAAGIDGAAGAALVAGTAPARYSPAPGLTRAQMATALSRALARLVDAEVAARPR